MKNIWNGIKESINTKRDMKYKITINDPKHI